MFVIQHYSLLWRPGKVEDGPPYGAPGMWHNLNSHESLERCVEGCKRIFAITLGDTRLRDKADYRIVEADSLGRIRRVFFSDGREVVPQTPEQRKTMRKALHEQRLPVAA